MNYIRGGIRKGLWNRHPLKLEFIKENRFKAPLGRKTKSNPEGLVWCCTCALSGNVYRQSDCQVDHKEGNHKLRSIEDLQSFVQAMLFVTEDDLQMVSKEYHKIKSYADAQGITLDEAKIQKEAIEIIKQKQDKVFLEGKGISPASNQTGRRQQIIEVLTNE